MPRVVFLNIETRPEVGTHWEQFRDLVPLGNRVSDDVILKHQNKEAPKLWKRTATDPFRAHFFCFTIMAQEDEAPEIYINDSERECTQKLEEWIRAFREEGQGPIQWHTFNGLRFDHPVLRLRAIKYGCPLLSAEMEAHKYGDQRHVDWFWKMGAYHEGKGLIRGKLDDIARFLHINHPNPITGGEIVDAWTRGNLEAIRLHSASRVLILRDLYHKLQALELPQVEHYEAGDEE